MIRSHVGYLGRLGLRVERRRLLDSSDDDSNMMTLPISLNFHAAFSETQAIHLFILLIWGGPVWSRVWVAFSICILSPLHCRRWINHGFEISFQPRVELLGFVSLFGGQIKLFGDIVNDIEELRRLNFTLRIHLCQ